MGREMIAYVCNDGCQPRSSKDGEKPIVACLACGTLNKQGAKKHQKCVYCDVMMEFPREVAVCQHLRNKMEIGMIRPKSKDLENGAGETAA